MKKYQKLILTTAGIISLMLITLTNSLPKEEMLRLDFVVFINGTLWISLIWLSWIFIKLLSKKNRKQMFAELAEGSEPKEEFPSFNPEEDYALFYAIEKTKQEIPKIISNAFLILLSIVPLMVFGLLLYTMTEIIIASLLVSYHLILLASCVFPLLFFLTFFFSAYLLISNRVQFIAQLKTLINHWRK